MWIGGRHLLHGGVNQAGDIVQLTPSAAWDERPARSDGGDAVVALRELTRRRVSLGLERAARLGYGERSRGARTPLLDDVRELVGD